MAAQNGADIVRRYYEYLENNQPHLLVDLYKEGSMMARLDNGVIVEEAYTVEDIAAIIMTWEFSDFQYRCFSWESWNEGILIVVIGSLRQAGFIGFRKFVQTLIIAPDLDDIFFICNDVFSFTGVEHEYVDGNLDNDDDPTSPGSVAVSDVTSQQVPMESDNFLQSEPQNNTDESTASAEIDSSTGLPNSPATIDQVLNQQPSNPEHVKELLTDTEDTDIESLMALAHKMRVEPQMTESDELPHSENISLESSALSCEETTVDTDLDSVSCVPDAFSDS